MQVILLENVRNLGKLGELVHIKPGFGRNFLIPQNKAVFATKENVALFEKRRDELEKKAALTLKKAQDRAEQLNAISLQLTAQATDEGRLFGSIGVNEIKQALLDKGVEVSRREIVLSEGAFHSIGEYTVELILHSDVAAHLQLTIVAAK